MTGSAFKRWTLYCASGGLYYTAREGVWGREGARDCRPSRAGGFFLRSFFALGAVLEWSWAILGGLRAFLVVLGAVLDALGSVLGGLGSLLAALWPLLGCS